jgi:uncharacterized protein YecE (DUF72 family)
MIVGKRKIFIGTSGFHYDHWIGPFYPDGLAAKDFLKFYKKHFQTVELNNTFYHLPQPQTIINWRDGVPARFVFAVKASRFITHVKKLNEPEDSLKIFFERMKLFGNKIGPILFQFPPRWKFNFKRLSAFLPLLSKKYRYAFEFRDQSWFNQQIYDLLAEHNAAFCIYDLGGTVSPKIITSDFVYIRLHGPSSAYAGNYSDKALANWAKDIMNWAKQGKDVYCYFNNDQAAYAVKNAARLIEIIEKPLT